MGELFQGAMPDNLLILGFDRAEAGFKQRATARPLPFAMFRLQLPRFEMRTIPAKTFGSDVMQRGEGRDSTAGQDVRGTFIE